MLPDRGLDLSRLHDVIRHATIRFDVIFVGAPSTQPAVWNCFWDIKNLNHIRSRPLPSGSRVVIGHVTVRFADRFPIGAPLVWHSTAKVFISRYWGSNFSVTPSVTWSFVSRYVVYPVLCWHFLPNWYRYRDISLLSSNAKPGLHYSSVNRHVAHCACALSRERVLACRGSKITTYRYLEFPSPLLNTVGRCVIFQRPHWVDAIDFHLMESTSGRLDSV